MAGQERWNRLVLVGLASGILLGMLGLGMLTGWWVGRWMGSGATPKIADSPTMIRQVQGLNQLVSVKYVLEKVILVEDAKWYGDSRVLMVANGVAKAGVDLSRLQPEDFVVEANRVRVTLPRPQLLDVYLDDRRTQVIERTTGVLREFDKGLEQEARRQAVDQMRLAVRDAGIFRDAEERARLQVEGLLGRAGFEEVEVRFR